ncbi:hypothetical protein ACFLRP_01370 [Bacteroidota bacterium]
MAENSLEPRLYRIGGVEIGGKTGEYPTVVIGSLFFRGHRLVSDAQSGSFDQGGAASLLAREEELSEIYGIPYFVDPIGETTKALTRYIEFIAAHTTAPILIDSPSQAVRLETLRYFAASELMPRLIYNAIAEDYTEEEIACLRECKVESSIVLAFSSRAIRPTDRLKLLQERLLPQATGRDRAHPGRHRGARCTQPGLGWRNHEAGQRNPGLTLRLCPG